MKKLKLLALTLVSIMLLGTLAAFGNINAADHTIKDHESNYATSINEAKAQLSFWTLGNANYEELAQEYTKEHPNITINIQNSSDETTHHNNLMNALVSGSGAPDIFQLETGFTERFINELDKFYNLNDYGARDIRDNYLDWKWKQASSIDGSYQLGLPADISPTVVYYRTDLVEAAGLPGDPEDFGAAIDTWDKFAAVAKAYTDKTGKYFTDLTDLTYNALRDQSADNIYYNKIDGRFIGDTNPQVKKAYDFTVKGILEGWISSVQMASPEWNQGMNDGSFAVVMGPAWMAGNIKSSAARSSGNWRIAQLPEGAGNWGGSSITLPKEGKHPKEAYEFISWLVSKENQLESFKTTGLIPSIPALYEDPAFVKFKDDFFGGQQTAAEFGEAAKRVKSVYYGPLHDQTDNFFKNALKKVSEQQEDPTKAWDDAVKQSETLAERN